MRRLWPVLLLLPLLLAGCSSNNPGASPPSSAPSTVQAAPDTIVIKNFMFAPADLTVAPGAKVKVTNQDTATHTVQSTATPPAFDSGDIAPGKTITFTAPSKAGRYTYICQIHQYMQGTLTVS